MHAGNGVGEKGKKKEREREKTRPYNTRVSVYRSEAWANQTDIIDLTCDLEIRKIADGEGLEPIIIVNTGRPSPFYLPLPPNTLFRLFLSLLLFNG